MFFCTLCQDDDFEQPGIEFHLALPSHREEERRLDFEAGHVKKLVQRCQIVQKRSVDAQQWPFDGLGLNSWETKTEKNDDVLFLSIMERVSGLVDTLDYYEVKSAICDYILLENVIVKPPPIPNNVPWGCNYHKKRQFRQEQLQEENAINDKLKDLFILLRQKESKGRVAAMKDLFKKVDVDKDFTFIVIKITEFSGDCDKE
jgi:hypothetical protein